VIIKHGIRHTLHLHNFRVHSSRQEQLRSFSRSTHHGNPGNKIQPFPHPSFLEIFQITLIMEIDGDIE